MKKSVLCVLSYAFSALLIAQLSSSLIIQSNSKQIQIHEEDTLKLGTKILINWIHRQIVLGSLQPITSINFPRIFKKTAFSILSPIHL